MKFKSLAGVSAAALLAASPALAQSTSPPPTTKQEINKGATSQPENRSPSTMGSDERSSTLTLTEQQANSWIDKPVYSSDGKEVGEIVSFNRGADNKVTEMHADIGGLLGLGETRVKIAPSQFKLEGDRAVLNMTEAQAKNLPKVSK
jgi:hypothetical protein